MTEPVQVTASNVSTPGQFGAAISAKGGSGGVTVTIPSGSITGGWQATPFTFTPGTPPAPIAPLLPGRPPASGTAPGNISLISGLPAAGVFLSANGGGVAASINDGSIGALSDLAIVGDPEVTNNGTIIGFTQFTGGGNSIANNGTFDLRHFADTTGAVGGVRDTVRVAMADLGAGANNTFTNNGTLRLLNVTGATTLGSTGEYLPVANTSLGNFRMRWRLAALCRVK
jgi:hypothetical protein